MKIKTKELIRTSQSWDGAQLPNFPQGQPELRVIRLDFPVGAKTGWHHHPVVNYGIVQQGTLTIVCRDGTEKTFREGEALVEVIGTIHRGENRGSKPVILNMFYFCSPGEEVTVQHPELEPQEPVSGLKPVSREDERVYRLVVILGRQILPRRQLLADLHMQQSSRAIFIANYLQPAMERGLVAMNCPGTPTMPEQAYRLTSKGLEFYNQLTTRPF